MNKWLQATRRSRMNRLAKQFFLASMVAFAACLPAEETVTEEQLVGDSKGFKGIEAADTISASKVKVSWNPSGSAEISGYNIYDVTLTSQPRLLKSVSATQQQATIAGLSEGFFYSFRVRAYDENGIEDPNVKDIPAIPYGGAKSVEVVSSTSVKIHFSDASESEALEANVYCETGDGVWERMANVRNLTETSVVLDELVPNTTYSCRAAIVVDGFEDNNQEILTFVPMGEAVRLAFVIEPGTGAAGSLLNQQPVVHVLDENDNIVAGGPDAAALITLTLSGDSPTPGVVQGTATVAAVGGVATFNDLSMQEAGTKILTATKEDTSAQEFGVGPLSIDSQSFAIIPGAPSADNSVIAINPAVPPSAPLVANGSNSYVVEITLADAYGNAIPGIKPTFESNIIGDILAQPTVSTDSTGLVTGSITTTVADSTPPYRNLYITSPAGLTDVEVLAPFQAGSASKLAFTIQPVNSPAGDLGMNEMKVAIQDAQGNTVVDATDTINIAIASNVNGATLSGTVAVSAVAGVATFSDLGIDITDNGYRLVASSGSMTPAYSNTFNVTAGIPRAIAIMGADSVYSGACSGAITFQLQDLGGNPAKAIQNTPINIGGLGSASLYTSGSCGGSPVGTSLTFTAGTDTRVLYLRDLKAESLTITATDTSALLTAGNHPFRVNPNKLALVAQTSGGATPLTVTAGKCSTEILINPMGDDGSPGAVLEATTINVTGITGSQAKIYSDASCTTELDPLSVSLGLNPLPNVETKIYLKDDRAENLLMNVSDPSGNMATVSLPQDVRVLASDINFTGPTTVVAGQCSSVFSIALEDTLGNAVTASSNTTIMINGLSGFSATGLFYTSASCSGGGVNNQLTIPSGNSSIQVYFKGIEAEVLDIFMADPLGEMNDSQSIQLSVSPSALQIVGPGGTQSLSSECIGPFQVNTLDGIGNPANVVNTVNVSLSGGSTAGKFYEESSCETENTALSFAVGEGQKTFYFKGQFPESSLTLTATDNAAVLSSGAMAWQVTADWGWFGTASVQNDEFGNLQPFQTGIKPVAARYDGIRSAGAMALDPTGTYLTVADYYGNRIVRYNYATHEYIGWTGRIRVEAGVGSTGSNLANPSPALCVSSTNNEQLPGWCVGGRSISGNQTLGGVTNPRGIHDDGSYVYVTGYNSHVVTRYDSATGAFAGWVGTVNTVSPTSAGPGGPATCTTTPNGTVTPGWCIGGNSTNGNTTADRIQYPWGINSDANYIYVGNRGSVVRYDKATGSYQGWIGMVSSTPSGGAVGCTATGNNQLTPGWCTGGARKAVNPINHSGIAGGMNNVSELVIQGTDLYVFTSGYSGVINRYNKDTGAFIETLPHLSFNWVNALGGTTNGTHIFVADDERVLKVSLTGLVEGWMGKVANNAGMSGVTGCSSLAPNDNTPGWCIGGTHKPGLDEDSFIDTEAIVYDNNNHILVSGTRFPGIKKFNATTGAYVGTFGLKSISPKEWSSDRTLSSESFGFDDDSMYTPSGVLVEGDYLFVMEDDGSRIKKLNRYTGELLGWIGGMTSKPTGGVSASCLSANAMSPAPTWCLGANFYPTFTWNDANMIDDIADGILHRPMGMSSDGTWLYVTDRGVHRIQRFRVSDGTYGGWIGRINISPTGGDPGCNGAPSDSFTPGWCTGGISESGSGDGNLRNPSGITYLAGNLYVVGAYYGKISSFNATTGAFNGWIGRVNAAPSAGCTTGSNTQYTVSKTGWCRGGTARESSAPNDRGGGFNFQSDLYGDITTDGTYLYVANSRNARIDKISLNGEFLGAAETREDQYTNVWVTDPTDVGSAGQNCSYPVSLWVDGATVYGLNAYPCDRDGDTMAIWRMDKTLGQINGWKGGIAPAFPPTGGDPGCAGATISTPGWCTGGYVGLGLKLGQFSGLYGQIFGDTHYLYVTDRSANRTIRVPK